MYVIEVYNFTSVKKFYNKALYYLTVMLYISEAYESNSHKNQ